MHLRACVSTILFLLCTLTARSQNKTAFYIAGHPDDWQLFMGNDAYADIQQEGNKVIFIVVTAGDASCNDNEPKSRFAMAREKGAVAAMLFCEDINTTTDSLHYVPYTTLVNNHPILCHPYKNSKTYFLRLPDGCGSTGFDGQSLAYLYHQGITKMTAIDRSTSYQGWGDLVQTIREIIAIESSGKKNIVINYQDHDDEFNEGDHPDHKYSGLAASQAAAAFPNMRHNGYMDYNIRTKRPNLTADEIAIKAGLFGVTDFAITRDGYNTTFANNHIRYLSRTYSRRLPAVDSAGNPFYSSLLKAVPNPVADETVALQFGMNSVETVTVQLHNLQGRLIWKQSDIQTIRGEHTLTIPLQGTPPGIYFITLITQAGSEYLKLVRL